MCRKLKELHGLSAEDLLKKVGQEDVVPVDIAQMCYDLDIRLNAFDFSSVEQVLNKDRKSVSSILGTTLVKEDDIAILYKQDDTVNRKRFTIAHELAHCCLHLDLSAKIHIEFRLDDADSVPPKEIEANIFAGQLLIPFHSLKRFVGDEPCISKEKFQVLTNIFMVSENVMKARLETLHIQVL